MGARKGEVRETGRGGGPGVGEAALAEGEGLERGGGEEWVGERAVAPLGRADERDLAGAAVAGREVVEPGLRGGDAGAEGGAGEAEARDGARVGGEREGDGVGARRPGCSRRRRGAGDGGAGRDGKLEVVEAERGPTPRVAPARGEHGGARGLGGIEAGDDRREELKREVADEVLAAGIASQRRRHLAAPGFCGGLGGEVLFTKRIWLFSGEFGDFGGKEAWTVENGDERASSWTEPVTVS